MLNIDKDKFLAGYSSAFGAASTTQTTGLTSLVTKVTQDSGCWPTVQQFAYGLATFKWETAHTFQPITEFGSHDYFDKYEPGTPIGKALGNTVPGDGFLFRGRGYVQVTGRGNYTKDGDLLGIDLVSDPDQALDPDTAWQIASTGMRDGWFTGRKLETYIPAAGGTPDYTNARRIINGTDHAADIAAIAVKFEAILTASLVVATSGDSDASSDSTTDAADAQPADATAEGTAAAAAGGSE